MEASDTQHETADHVVHAFMSRLPRPNRAWLRVGTQAFIGSGHIGTNAA